MKTLNTCVAMLCILFAHINAGAQVGIGTTTPNSSSILDMTSTTKGLLAPRMNAAQKNAVASPATGLLIYQTDGTAGFYYYDGTQWLMLVDENRGWGTTGNANLVDGTNFLGTTDLVPLALKVNNEKSGLIDPINTVTTYGYQSGNVNTAAGSTFFGNLSGKANTTGTGNSAFGNSALTVCNTGTNNSAFGTLTLTANTTGFDNSAFGYNALKTNITGAQNTAMGSGSLFSATGNGNSAFGQNALYTTNTGTYNAASGVNSLRLNTTGARNVGQGYLSLEHNTTGSDNVGIGYNAGVTNTTGGYNTCIGSNSNVNATGLNNATAIGCYSLVSASNCLVLGSSNSIYAVKVGINVPSPTNTLSFDGTAARTIWLERNTTAATAGFSLTLQSGGAYSTGTNLNGGDLNLSSGTSTGTGTSNISFSTSTAGGSGSADNAPTTKMTIMGSGNVGIGITTPGTTLQVVGGITSTSPTSGIGYATGAGGTVTQLTSKSTGVTLSKNCGTITLNNAALAAGAVVSFTVTNTSVAANDVVYTQHDSGGTIGAYTVTANTMAAGSYKITVRNNTAGSLSEAIVIRFVVIKAVNN